MGPHFLKQTKNSRKRLPENLERRCSLEVNGFLHIHYIDPRCISCQSECYQIELSSTVDELKKDLAFTALQAKHVQHIHPSVRCTMSSPQKSGEASSFTSYEMQSDPAIKGKDNLAAATELRRLSSSTSTRSLQARVHSLSRNQRKRLIIENRSPSIVDKRTSSSEPNSPAASTPTTLTKESGTKREHNNNSQDWKRVARRGAAHTTLSPKPESAVVSSRPNSSHKNTKKQNAILNDGLDPDDDVLDTSSSPKQQTANAYNQVNHLALHVYDLIARNTHMVVPCGCLVDVGEIFTDVNSALHELGTGAYHVGVEVNGIGYAYGSTKSTGVTGVFACYPRRSPGYQYRTTIDLGARPLVRRLQPVLDRHGQPVLPGQQLEQPVDAKMILREMAQEYMGSDYDLLRKNCCSFACDACERLGVDKDEIPSWFRNLAQTGAITQDVAYSHVIEPITSITSVLSNLEESNPDD